MHTHCGRGFVFANSGKVEKAMLLKCEDQALESRGRGPQRFGSVVSHHVLAVEERCGFNFEFHVHLSTYGSCKRDRLDNPILQCHR
jgi:hypothetical protein